MRTRADVLLARKHHVLPRGRVRIEDTPVYPEHNLTTCINRCRQSEAGQPPWNAINLDQPVYRERTESTVRRNAELSWFQEQSRLRLASSHVDVTSVQHGPRIRDGVILRGIDAVCRGCRHRIRSAMRESVSRS